MPKLEIAFYAMVGERSICSEAVVVKHGGADRSENAGMSSEI